MDNRTPMIARPEGASSAATLLLVELEMPTSSAFEALEAGLETRLYELEERFRGFVTHNSLAGSIGRKL